MAISSGVVSAGANARNVKRLSPEDVLKQMKSARDRDAEMVTGIFHNIEAPGMSVEFSYKMYPGDDNVTYSLLHGEKYRIPRGVARHLSTNCYLKEYVDLPNLEGVKASTVDYGRLGMASDGIMRNATEMKIIKKHQRFAFLSMEFSDDDNLDLQPSNLVEVKSAL